MEIEEARIGVNRAGKGGSAKGFTLDATTIAAEKGVFMLNQGIPYCSAPDVAI